LRGPPPIVTFGNGLGSLARGDASKKKRLDLAQETWPRSAEFLVMRRAFERRVDQQATPPLLVIQGSLNDFLQERDNRISRGKAVLKTANAARGRSGRDSD